MSLLEPTSRDDPGSSTLPATGRRPLHIVQIIESFGAGTLQAVAAITRAMSERGARTTVFHGNRAETPQDFQALFPEGVDFRPLATGRAVNGVIDAYDAARIALFAVRHRVDVLHGHSSKGGALARMAGLLSGTPTVYTPHGFAFLTNGGPDRGKIAYKFERLLGRLPALTVCCSTSEAEVALLLSPRVTSIPNFIDLAAVDAMRARVPRDSGADILGVGRISAQKNLPLFFALARRNPQMRCVWIGGPTSELDGETPPDNVEITGWLSRDESLARIAACKVFVSTSRFEGMPIALMEAMAMEIPVVCTDVAGNRDLVEDGATGYLRDDEDGLHAVIGQLLADPAARARLGQGGRRKLERENAPDVLRERWAELYDTVAKRSR